MKTSSDPTGRKPAPGLAAFLLFLVTACESLPTDYQQLPESVSSKPDPATQLGRLDADFNRRHGAGMSGYAVVDRNADGLRWRLTMVDSAERTLDVLY